MMKDLNIKETNQGVHDTLSKTLTIDFGTLSHNERVHIKRRDGLVDLLCFESFLLREDTSSSRSRRHRVEEKGADEDTFLNHTKTRERHLEDEEEEEEEKDIVMRVLLDMKRKILQSFSHVFEETDRLTSIRSITHDMMLNMRARSTRKYRKQCRLTQTHVRDAQRTLLGFEVYDAEFELDSDEMEDSMNWTKKFDERANRPYWHNKINGRIKLMPDVELVTRLTTHIPDSILRLLTSYSMLLNSGNFFRNVNTRMFLTHILRDSTPSLTFPILY